MKRLLLFALAWVLLLEIAISKENTKLLFVQILFRHGDRAPIDLYPNDPNPVSVWPEGLAKLTQLGKKQHYALGKFFRSMYENFTTSNPLEVNVISSEVDRCLKSAETNLASFYAPSPQWSFDTQFKWQPISVHYIPKMEDRYLEVESYCPRATEELENVVKSAEGQRIIQEHEFMFKNLTFYSGNPIDNWTTANYLHDVMYIEKKYNLTVPTWIEPFWDELTYVSNMSFYWSFNSPLLHRLRAGPLLQRIINKMNDKINGDTPDLKFQIYSAHDTNIAIVLDALNLFDMNAPPYCSALLFELHEMSNGEKTLRLLYQNSSKPEEKIDPPHVLILEGCTEYCPLEYFINYTSPLMPGDWDAECQLDKSFVDKIKERKVTIGWFFILAAVVTATVSIYALWRMCYRRQDKSGISAVKYSSLDP
ncbi:testicular acid phosphatase homolog [Trichonephila clavata]|uniref:acid phosphatase n=1 Tax=Trichonephila clavata TaxID=2740835 RepID=A0A8X6M3K9_TRICU|nr:testicular acid phosphatase homolog [Trichonephila clavata]